MNKIAILILAANETHGDLGRVVNAVQIAKEFQQGGDEVTILFDGGGVEWIPELSNPNHDAHPMFEAVRDQIAGTCKFCSNAFGVKEQIAETEIPLLGDFEGHPSVKHLVDNGYRVLTF